MGIDAEMFSRTKAMLSEMDVRMLAGDLCASFGKEFFLLEKVGRHGPPRHALSIVPTWEQDGPDITPDAGELFIRCHLMTRYYGLGYERGNWPLIRAIGEWMEARIGPVWYGGDSGVLAEPFPETRRQELNQLFIRVGHSPYLRSGARDAPICEFCGNRPMWNQGGGPGYLKWSCDACGAESKVPV